VKIALLSLDSKLSFDDRLSKIKEVASLSAKNGAKLLLLPELSYCGYYPDDIDKFAKYDEGEALGFFEALVGQYGIYIGFGNIKKTSKKYLNRYLIIGPNGVVAKYDKMHIFGFGGEDKAFEPGSSAVSFEIDKIKFGLSVCYDLRFGELYSLYASDCDAVLCPAAWPKKRVREWKLLLRARAVENRFKTIGINWQGGVYTKSSLISNENGIFIKPVFSASDIDIYDIKQKKQNAKTPNSADDKRFKLYAELFASKAENVK
jgi:predicted amidohydrolase